MEIQKDLNIESNKNDSNKLNYEILWQTDELTYEILTSKDKDESKLIVSTAFLDEPLMKTISNNFQPIKLADFDKIFELFVNEVCTNKLSVIARNKNTNKIVAVCYNIDYNFWDEKFEDYCSDKSQILRIVFGFLGSVSEKVKIINPDLEKKNTVIDIFMLAVLPETRGKKVSNKLVELSINEIKKSGFQYACCEATSQYTRKNMKSYNFECILKEDVKKWIFEDKYYFENVEAIHEEFTFWVKKFYD